MKNKFSTHVTYFWWVYVLLAVIIAMVWTYSMDAALRPKNTQKITITTFSDNVKTSELNSSLNEIMPQITKQEILEIRVGNVKEQLTDPSLLNSFLYARAQESDFMIVEESLVATTEKFASAYFNPVDENTIKSEFGEVNFWRETANGKEYSFGILLNDNGTQNNFTRYYNGESKCWLFFCFKTDNMGGLLGKGESKNDAALQTIKWLLREGN